MAKKREPYQPIYPDKWSKGRMLALSWVWKREVLDQAHLVDPNSESKWGDLAMGYALGKGLDPDQAADFELYLSHKRMI